MGKVWQFLIDTRLTIVAFVLLGMLFLKYPLALVALMVLGLAYCVYRILKEREVALQTAKYPNASAVQPVAQGFSKEYQFKTDNELLQLAADVDELVPEAGDALNAEIARRGLSESLQQKALPQNEGLYKTGPEDRSSEEWAKRRAQFRWVWMAFGAFMALGVILMKECNGR